MKRRSLILTISLAFALALSGCASAPSGPGWTTLIDGANGLDNWNLVGDANWRPKKIGADNAYEVNIWDIRPDPSYGTGAIVNFAKVSVPIVNKAGGQWNVMEVVAQGASLTVKLNGVITSTLQDSKFTSGPFALQFGPGVNNVTGGPIKWRKVMIKPS